MSLSDPFIDRPVTSTLLMVAVLAVGILAYVMLPLAPLPQVDFPTIAVEAAMPGASAETMATAVATPLERSFSAISGVTQMTSSSSLGATGVTLQFDLGKNIDAAAQEVQSAITAASGTLPRDLPSPPVFHKVNPADFTILSLALTSESLPLTEIDRCADELLASQLSQLPGVGLVDFHGEAKPAIRIRIDPDALSHVGLTLEDVRSLLGVVTVNAPKGEFDGPSGSVALATTDQLLDAAAVQQAVIAYRNGMPVRVRDLGRAVDGPEDQRESAWLDDRRAIIVDIHKQPGFNVLQTITGIQQRLPGLQAALPSRIQVRVVGDRSQTIHASLLEVERTLLLTLVLVVLVIWLFLRDLRSTLIPALTIPLSFAGTTLVMHLLDYSIDNISLMALTIAVGFVVDDAIVVIENCSRHIESGMPVLPAVRRGAREVGFTVVSMTVSLIAVFIPVLFMGGIIGRMFREFAVTLSVAVVMSGIVALTVTPMLCAVLLTTRSQGSEAAWPARLAERGFTACARFYEQCLDHVLRHRILTLTVFAATLAATIGMYIVVPKGFFPEQDTGLIIGVAEAAPDIGSAEMGRRIQQLVQIARADPDVDNVYCWIGANPTLSQGRVMINLTPFATHRASARAIMRRLAPRLARVEGIHLFMQLRQDIQVGGRPAKTQYQYTLQGADSVELATWARRLQAAMSGLRQVRDVTADIEADAPSVSLEIDRDTAARFGITAQLIDDTLYDAFGQRQVATIFTQLNQYHLILEVSPEHQVDAQALSHLYIRSPLSAQLVPLSQLVSIATTLAPITINHQNIFPAITLSFNVAPGYALGDAVAEVTRLERGMDLPPSIHGSFQGSAQAFQDSLATQPWLILAAVGAVYLVLGMLYESFIQPLTILSTLPSAGLGGLLALQLTGNDLSVMALIGILLLIGIVKKNAIMMVDVALVDSRTTGSSPQAAIRRAALQRFRPIMMTTAAALLGALPLALGAGAGAELRRPLGITIIGGLLLSQLLTLLTTPVIYIVIESLRVRLAAWRRGGGEAGSGRSAPAAASTATGDADAVADLRLPGEPG